MTEGSAQEWYSKPRQSLPPMAAKQYCSEVSRVGLVRYRATAARVQDFVDDNLQGWVNSWLAPWVAHGRKYGFCIARQVGWPVSDSKDGRSLRVEEDGVREASRQGLCCGMSRERSVDDLLLLGVALAVAGSALLLTGRGGALAVALDVHLENDGMMDEAINCGERHGGIREDVCPFAERSIGRYQQATPFVA